MRIMEGVLVGIVFFIVGWITYLGIRFSFAMDRLVQVVKANPGVRGQAQGGAIYYRPWSDYLHDPVIWITFLTAIAIGLWIMRARAIHTV